MANPLPCVCVPRKKGERGGGVGGLGMTARAEIASMGKRRRRMGKRRERDIYATRKRTRTNVEFKTSIALFKNKCSI